HIPYFPPFPLVPLTTPSGYISSVTPVRHLKNLFVLRHLSYISNAISDTNDAQQPPPQKPGHVVVILISESMCFPRETIHQQEKPGNEFKPQDRALRRTELRMDAT
ncbi:hypothetical protein CEXT_228041, partial [Caerostris extrusa]